MGASTNDRIDIEDGGSINGNHNNGDRFSDEDDDDATENPGLMRHRRGSVYESVATNHSYYPVAQRGFSVLCQTVVVAAAVFLVGTAGFLVGSGAIDTATPKDATTGFDAFTGETNNNDTLGLLEEKKTTDKTAKTVHYDPEAVLANNPLEHLFDAPAKTSLFPSWHPTTTTTTPAGFFKHPHLVGNRLVFVSEGDAYVTTLLEKDQQKSSMMPASRLTTTVGNVGTPKWHPTLPLLAYTATYSGRRDVYLMDLSFQKHKSPVRLTYWDVSAGVSGIVGWISSSGSGGEADALVVRAFSNDASSLPDYRLYVLHLKNLNNNNNDDGPLSALEVEPVPLAQAMDAARFGTCWYFVRVKQSSKTIRYVGGTAENLWKYCEDGASSQSSTPLLDNDAYKGTSKSPQLYKNHSDNKDYLFFLSDRGLVGKEWIPDRMNIWALPLNANNVYSPKDLIRITDTACDFEGRTIREFSIDAKTGDLVARIGADLFFMEQATVHEKLLTKQRRRRGRRSLQEIPDEQPPILAEDPDIVPQIDDGKDEASNTTTKTILPEDTTAAPSVAPPLKAETTAKNNTNAVAAAETKQDVAEADTDNSNNNTASKLYYNYKAPQLVARKSAEEKDHYSGDSSELKRLPIVVYSDFFQDQERIVPVDIMKHFVMGDVYETITGSTQILLTLRGQAWVAPVTEDEVPSYKAAGKNLPARRYRVAPGSMMGGSTRVLAALHVPNPVEDETSDRRLAVVLATDPLTPTAEHAFYLVETQPGSSPLFLSMDQLPKPFLGGIVSGGSTRDGGLGSVRTDSLVVSPSGNRMAWSNTDGRIAVMNLPQYQQQSDDKKPAKYVVLPKQNELGEPMVGNDVELTFSPGGRYLTITHKAKNQFLVISIADLGDPLGSSSEDHKIADIAIGRIVQVTPSRFNSMSVYWGKTPTDIHDFAQNKTMSKLFKVDEPADVSTALYFLSDRDIKTDVSSPWGYRQRMPHFVDSLAVYVLPLVAKGAPADQARGAFRGDGGEELQVGALLDRMELLKKLLEQDTTSTTAAAASRRKLIKSLHPLAGAFGYAERAFDEQQKRRRVADNDDDDDHLKEADFDKDMDIDFGPVDLTFARTAYRLPKIPAGNYDTILSQTPSGDLVLVEEHSLSIFQAEAFPSDQYEKKTFVATSRKIAAYKLSSNREYLILVYAPDGAIKIVPNTASGVTALQADLVLDDNVVDKKGMHLSIWPSLEYRQLYDDAWRMLRDYFYDPDMTGIDWPAVHERYLPLVERCSKREELDDVLGQMASELSALHVFVYGGEYNSPTHGDKTLEYANEVGSLGAILKRTPAWKGYTVVLIPEIDPDFTKIDQSSTFYSPLSDQSLRLSGQRGLQAGDVIVGVNGESVVSVPDIHMLLRGTSGRSVRLEVLRLASGSNETTTKEARVESIVTVPISPDANGDLLYRSWEYKTEQLAQSLAAEAGISVGYVHLQDMSGASAEDAFARGFFPNYHKQGFILDVRHNRGGNIDSWVLDVLQRKAWMYWESRDMNPETGGLGWDEHYAFRGHIVVLVNEKTSSDGEGVSRGIAELGLGKIIGTRTWGGGIWLASDNKLVDGGIASAPEIGVYNEHLSWGMGIENMGLDPDIVVDNDPHEAYTGRDRQLETAIEVLKQWIADEPVVVPKPKSKRKDVTMGERECKANELQLGGSKIGRSGAKALGDALKHNSSLTKLNLCGTGILSEGAKGLADGLKQNTGLAHLNLTSTGICAEGVKALASALKQNTTLSRLQFVYCKIGDGGVKALANALKQNRGLTHLDLSFTGICAEGAKALSCALKENTTLKLLDFLDCKIGDDGAEALADALKQNRGLAHLRLIYTGICAEGAKALACALKENTTLSRLYLSHGKIGDVGANALADVLKQNRSLAHLGLNSAGISDEGANALCDALAENTTLEVLEIQWNRVGEENLKIIRFFLRLNKLGRNILYLPIHVSVPFWKNLAYGPRDVLYCLIRERAGSFTESSNKRMKNCDGTLFPLPASAGIG